MLVVMEEYGCEQETNKMLRHERQGTQAHQMVFCSVSRGSCEAEIHFHVYLLNSKQKPSTRVYLEVSEVA